MPNPIIIDYDKARQQLTVSEEPAKRSVTVDRFIEWKCTPNVKDWRVVFGAYAPVHSKGKVASPDEPKLKLTKQRPEDLGHWKYVVVGMIEETEGGVKQYKLKDLDPEMIVEG